MLYFAHLPGSRLDVDSAASAGEGALHAQEEAPLGVLFLPLLVD